MPAFRPWCGVGAAHADDFLEERQQRFGDVGNALGQVIHEFTVLRRIDGTDFGKNAFARYELLPGVHVISLAFEKIESGAIVTTLTKPLHPTLPLPDHRSTIEGPATRGGPAG